MSEEDNIVILPVMTNLDLPAERILQGALKADLEQVILIGREKDGSTYFASSYGKCKDVLWDLEQFKIYLTNQNI